MASDPTGSGPETGVGAKGQKSVGSEAVYQDLVRKATEYAMQNCERHLRRRQAERVAGLSSGSNGTVTMPLTHETTALAVTTAFS